MNGTINENPSMKLYDFETVVLERIYKTMNGTCEGQGD